MSHWIYEGKELTEVPDGCVGFVYLITCIPTGQLYVGRKTFISTSRKVVKGKTRRKKVVKESDWEKYYGSSEYMQSLVLTHGPESFKREILHLCKSKSECNYFETYEIFTRHALLRDEYINRWVTCQINSMTLKGLKEELKSNERN